MAFDIYRAGIRPLDVEIVDVVDSIDKRTRDTLSKITIKDGHDRVMQDGWARNKLEYKERLKKVNDNLIKEIGS